MSEESDLFTDRLNAAYRRLTKAIDDAAAKWSAVRKAEQEFNRARYEVEDANNAFAYLVVPTNNEELIKYTKMRAE